MWWVTAAYSSSLRIHYNDEHRDRKFRINGQGDLERRSGFIHRIVQMALRQRFLVMMLVLFLSIWGAVSFQRMPVDAYPDLSPPMVEIITQWPGHAAEEMERLVTLPLEVEMNGVPQPRCDAFHLALRTLRRAPDFPGGYGQLLRARECVPAPGGCQLPHGRNAEHWRRCSAPAAWSTAMCWKVPTAVRRN